MTAHETRRIRGQHPLVGQDEVGIYFPVGRRRFCGAFGPKLILTQISSRVVPCNLQRGVPPYRPS